MTLGDRLKRLRKEKRWTLKEVADKLGLSGHSTYSNWEYGRTEPDVETLKKIAELYEVELHLLLTGNTNPTDEIRKQTLNVLLEDIAFTWGPKELNNEDREKVIEILNLYQSLDSEDRERAIEMMKLFSRMKKDT